MSKMEDHARVREEHDNPKLNGASAAKVVSECSTEIDGVLSKYGPHAFMGIVSERFAINDDAQANSTVLIAKGCAECGLKGLAKMLVNSLPPQLWGEFAQMYAAEVDVVTNTEGQRPN